MELDGEVSTSFAAVMNRSLAQEIIQGSTRISAAMQGYTLPDMKPMMCKLVTNALLLNVNHTK